MDGECPANQEGHGNCLLVVCGAAGRPTKAEGRSPVRLWQFRGPNRVSGGMDLYRFHLICSRYAVAHSGSIRVARRGGRYRAQRTRSPQVCRRATTIIIKEQPSYAHFAARTCFLLRRSFCLYPNPTSHRWARAGCPWARKVRARPWASRTRKTFLMPPNLPALRAVSALR